MEYVGYVGKYKLDFNFLCISKAVQPVLSSISLKPTCLSNINLRINMYLKIWQRSYQSLSAATIKLLIVAQIIEFMTKIKSL